MKDEPNIVKELREAEKLGLFHSMIQSTFKELEASDESIDKTSNQTNYMIESSKKRTKKDELRNIEEKYKTIFENYAVAITLVDNEERIISWNKYTEELLNMTQNELYLKSVSSLYPSEEWQKIRAENVRQKGIKYRMETRMIKKNQGCFDVELSLCVLKGKEGKTVGSIGIIKDITKLKEKERELKESEERYRTIFENSAVAIMLTDEKERIISWNRFTENLLGIGKENLYLKPVKSIYPVEEWQKIRSKDIRRKGLQHHMETKVFKKNKEIIDVDLSLSVLKNHEGKVVGSIGVIQDITEYKQTQKALKESEQKYKDLVDLANDGIAVIQDNKVEFLNQGAAKMLGYTVNEIHGTKFDKYIAPEVKKMLIQRYKDKMAGKKTPNLYESMLLKKDGITIPVEINTRIIEYKGRPADFAIVRDITDRKKAEEELQKSENKFRNLAENLPNMIFINKRGKVVYANRKCEEIMGYTREDFYSPNFDFLSLIAPESKEMIMKSFKRHMNGEEIDPYEYSLITKNGKKFEAIITTKLIKYEEDAAILGIITDIDKIKKAEEELKKAHLKVANLNQELEKRVEARTTEVQELLNQKNDFINQLSHDLKNPLTPLIGLLPILEKMEKDPKSKELIKLLGKNINRIKNIVIKILELSQLNTPDATVFYINDINLWEEAENCIKDQQLIYNIRNITLENKIAENIFVKADKVRLSEVFNNLINNAIKYSQPGGNITIDAHGDRDIVTISIKDSGIGMTTEQIDHIFDEFYKADISRHDFDSSGLGLSICKRIVEKHGGEIWAESPGLEKGSTFYFTVPIGSKIGKAYD